MIDFIVAMLPVFSFVGACVAVLMAKGAHDRIDELEASLRQSKNK